MISSVKDFNNPFFIGVAGSGMSALAQYLNGIGKNVAGSDRFFSPGIFNETRDKLEAEGIKCFIQDGSGISPETDLVIASTAIEDTVTEVQKARQLGIPILKRSELLALIAKSKRTIAVAGTSGKSTTSAMLFDILHYAGLYPSIISGAGLISIIKQGKIGNAYVGEGDWLVIEADESDGSIVQYEPEIGLLLNIDKDHQEIKELIDLFTIFRNNSKKFITNQSHELAKKLSLDNCIDFSTGTEAEAGVIASGFHQSGFTISFDIGKTRFDMHQSGKHNMENAVAAVAAAIQAGVDVETCSKALSKYEGIYRRFQVYGNKHGVWFVDDYAHNPVKCAAAIKACHPVAPKVIAWFQPHGFKPTKFLRADFVKEIGDALRPEDEIWFSEIYYAGGTAIKDISANDLIEDLRANGKSAFYVADRSEFLNEARSHFSSNCVLLLMGARDPSLEEFAKKTWQQL